MYSENETKYIQEIHSEVKHKRKAVKQISKEVTKTSKTNSFLVKNLGPMFNFR